MVKPRFASVVAMLLKEYQGDDAQRSGSWR
jgi:hypothetical protein